MREQDARHHARLEDTNIARVYRAIATAEGIRNWWTRDAVLDPKIGGDGEFGFYGRRFIAKVKIDALEPAARLKWRVTNAAWPGDIIEFELKPEKTHTRLLFAHRGFAQPDQSYASATTRWGYYLLSLKRHLEGGEGRPNPDDADR